ncbi:hypothetical protein FISHEDRAFT_73341 [Fistulina hepatica ATCC 64428]|uniref:Uncharacterized protein n=1 Tax=Fistulina hepatica ATCC 64428 TaxID=1128425 RepID=A0A0D7AFS8_9AGAR|nr:hypothetical protein FISHEDRAFT_73341 [Fistulina hepatica ATCC 64428]
MPAREILESNTFQQYLEAIGIEETKDLPIGGLELPRADEQATARDTTTERMAVGSLLIENLRNQPINPCSAGGLDALPWYIIQADYLPRPWFPSLPPRACTELLLMPPKSSSTAPKAAAPATQTSPAPPADEDIEMEVDRMISEVLAAPATVPDAKSPVTTAASNATAMPMPAKKPELPKFNKAAAAATKTLGDLPCKLPEYWKLQLSSPPRIIMSQASPAQPENPNVVLTFAELDVCLAYHEALGAGKRPDTPLVYLSLLRAWDRAKVLRDRAAMAYSWNHYDSDMGSIVLATYPVPRGMFAYAFEGLTGEAAIAREAGWYREAGPRKRTYEEMREELQGKKLRTVAVDSLIRDHEYKQRRYLEREAKREGFELEQK